MKRIRHWIFEVLTIGLPLLSLPLTSIANNTGPNAITGIDSAQFSTATLLQQTIKISGLVTDSVTQLPLSGVSIQVIGNKKGTLTDQSGAFSLEVLPEAILRISYTGYQTKEVIVKAQTSFAIKLTPAAYELDQVVVVGYGTQKKADLTGAVASINAEDVLKERPQSNVVEALQGTVAGLNINVTGTDAEGSNSMVRIRGNNSITADNKPLIILDGVPFDGPWSEINPEDIQKIDVLKDASSAAIYGARGANGVIIITTKKGIEGNFMVSYDGFVSFDHTINIPELMDGETFWKYKIEALKAANTITPTPDNPTPWLGSITPTEQRMHDAGKSTDWLAVGTRPGFKQQHNFSFRGGLKSTRYFVSFNHTDVKGVMLNDDFKRDQLRLNLSQSLASWLKFSTNTQFGRYDRSGYPPEFAGLFHMNPLAEPYDSAGNLRLSAWDDSSPAFAKNPLSATNEDNLDRNYKLITNNALEVIFPFISGLSYKLNTGYTYQTNVYKNYRGRDTYEGAQSNGELNTSNSEKTDWLIENILSYKKDFGRHKIFATGLYSSQSTVSDGNAVSGKDFPNDVMSFYQPSKAGTLSGTANYAKLNHVSQMVRLNYSFKETYLLTATARRDGFSAFGEDTKYGIFPSMALGWNLSNENFYKNSALSNVLTRLKYRLSWGRNGNEAVNAYVTLPNLSTFNYLSDDHKALYGFYPSKLESPDLGWETTSSVNTGLDFELANGRIQGSVDLYWSKTHDLLLSRTIPSINGTSSITENIGKTANQGYELQLTSNNIQHKNFSWSTTFNLTHYNTKIVDVGLYDQQGKTMDDIGSRWFIGYPISVNYDYVFDGIWQITDNNNPEGQQDPAIAYSIPGNIKYKNSDGQADITPDDKQIIGSTIPKFLISLTNSFQYKNFSFSFFLNSSFGRTARNSLLDVQDVSYRQNQLKKEFWTPQNPINTYPKNDLNGSVNPLKAGFYQKTDFIRLQDITLGYQLPVSLAQKIHMHQLSAYINVKNPAIWTKWDGLDPEFIGSQLAAPKTRSIILGLRITL